MMRPPGGDPGRIVFLNGVSSSGKSSIARHLLEALEQPWFHMPVDAFGAMLRPERPTDPSSGPELAEVLTRMRAGFHRAVAGMAAAGNNIVVDHVLSEPWRLVDCLRVFNGLDVVFVGVHCSIEELHRRELARRDRAPGQAAAQIAQVHAHGCYDLTCDTTTTGPEDCARMIVQFLAHRPPGPTAFDRLRAAGDTR
ncbi:chloramphenicol phosphotransferase CPT family protein [Plantactinospora siamensis]|uniref:Chloramphenicol phosphotransferase CPT family protein n=1 Tax=Plantactinospora siamensis TaxID=555372 RepID=A0ABV6NY13_9ACTN